MKKFLFNILKFVVAIIIVYPFVVFGWGKLLPAKLNKNIASETGSFSFSDERFKEIKSYGKVDVAILGSSHAFIGIDPRNFETQGYKAFNLGSSAQTPLQTEVIIKRYFDYLKPEVVVFEVFPRMFTIDGIESSMDLVRNDSVGVDYLQMAFESKNMKLINTAIFHYMNAGYSSRYGEQFKIDKEYVSGGFVEEKLKTIGPLNLESKKWTFMGEQFEALERTVSFLKNKGARVILIEAPYTSALYQSYENHKEFEERIVKVADYINYNGKVSLVDTVHFSDPDHLNMNGVQLFNERLVKDFINVIEKKKQ